MEGCGFGLKRVVNLGRHNIMMQNLDVQTLFSLQREKLCVQRGIHFNE